MKGDYNKYRYTENTRKNADNVGRNGWEDAIRKRLEGYEATPPEGLWEGIEANLSHEKPTKKRFLIPLRWLIATAAAVVLAILFVPKDKSEQALPKPIAIKPLERITNQPAQDTVRIQHRMPATTHSKYVALEKDSMETPVNEVITPPSDEKVITQVAPSLPLEMETVTEEYVSINHTKPSRWSFMVHIANGFTDADSRANVYMSDEMALLFRTPVARFESANEYRKDILLANYSEKTRHHQPISVGLSVAYNLSEQWQVTSGIVYTRLSSDFTKVLDGYEIESNQRLHYFGIPLSLLYNVWTHKKWRMYGGVGTQIDMNFKAELENDYVKKDIGKDRIQWSADAKAGMEYSIMPHLSVYIEPSVKYYFDNHSDINNLFKKRPLGYNIQTGVRLSK